MLVDFVDLAGPAEDLLEALAVAYEDPGFQAQLKKLCRDLRYDAAAFGRQLPTVALWAQAAVLPRFGFEATVAGAKEAEQAVKRAALAAQGEAQVELRRRSDTVTRRGWVVVHLGWQAALWGDAPRGLRALRAKKPQGGPMGQACSTINGVSQVFYVPRTC